jgi:hypothetical protein
MQVQCVHGAAGMMLTQQSVIASSPSGQIPFHGGGEGGDMALEPQQA